MKFLRLMLIAIAIGFITTCNAVANGITVKGMNSCEAWVKHRAERPAPSLGAIADRAWLDGYLSGVAVARNIDFLKNVDQSTIQLWMDNYCSSHPSELVGYAADALSIELKKRIP